MDIISNDKTSLVSVIIPVYNVEKYLLKCVKSILNQTYKDIEIILVDDGSTDSCRNICDDLKIKYNNISVIHKQNGGLGSARNAGLDVAKGEYIYFVDSDDYVEFDLLEKAIYNIENYDADCCSFGMIKEKENGDIIERIGYKPRLLEISNEKDRYAFLLKFLLNYRFGWEAWNRIFKASIIKENNLRFENEKKVYAEDLLFSYNYWLYAKKHVVLDEELYHYVQRGNSILNSKKNTNQLPSIYNLSTKVYESTLKSNQKYIINNVSMIIHQIIEWHCRDYINTKGINWLRKEKFKIYVKNFSKINNYLKNNDINKLIQKYGSVAGYISVGIFTNKTNDKIEVKKAINSLLSQQIQKLDILVFSTEELSYLKKDRRIRNIVIDNADNNKIYNSFINESYGEYLYIWNSKLNYSNDFLVKYSDALKYNDCGICFINQDKDEFLDSHNEKNKEKIKKMFINVPKYYQMLNKSLLLECVNEEETFSSIVANKHALIMKNGN